MAGIAEFDEDDWRETLAELRLLVTSAGFGEWDASMAAAIDEEEGLHESARWLVIRYAKGFSAFLGVRSEENLDRMRRDLGEFVRTERGQPVTDAETRDREGVVGLSLFGEPTSDGLIHELQLFVDGLVEDTGYFDDPEFDAS